MRPNNSSVEAGKFYKTRNGKKAYVAGISPFDSTAESRRAIGWVEGDEESTEWFASGHYHKYQDTESDLVAEWKEPKRIRGFVNLYPSETGMGIIANNVIHPSKKLADLFETGRRVACIEIDVEEGHGLSGEEC
ncbi:hypothetical protein [Mesorhizobium sp. B2-3-4]|uniref:hypothetical protein n=1 Tax=Mesorhizobium sp. B2-3-4 TaxID=2589959 RepID=UPI00112AEEAC|nr:hypothetical protein [Mesorhizobium sp. B2-3-4]TPM41406.1 hypothetical protein FJ967_00265 [Mesorhizobium sp. B2-3-4]